MILKGKKVLLVGLGVLGGGLATAKFLLKNGAKLTVTDLKNKEALKNTINKLDKRNIKFVLGKHRETDIKNNEIIVFNPAVPISSSWVKLAKKNKKEVYNDLSLFLNLLNTNKKEIPYIAVTGTRGKTTTTTWINYLIKGSVIGGNMPTKGFLDIIKKKTKLFVLELSSFQLEFITKGMLAPKVCVITNLYPDHLNRHKTLKTYIKEKAKIFLNQTKNDFLVLNADNTYTKEFLVQKPKSKIYFFSLKKLSSNKNGLFCIKNEIYFQEKRVLLKIADMPKNFADFQKSNLLAAVLAVVLDDKKIKLKNINNLPQIPLRQEIVFENKKLSVVNDSAGTSPNATIVAIERFKKDKNKSLILISGGTDKNLIFDDLAKKIKKDIKPEKLFLLAGSATNKLVNELKKIKYPVVNKQIFESLEEILSDVFLNLHEPSIIVFSPASASFEKFKNEFDRGKKFNSLIKKFVKN